MTSLATMSSSPALRALAPAASTAALLRCSVEVSPALLSTSKVAPVAVLSTKTLLPVCSAAPVVAAAAPSAAAADASKAAADLSVKLRALCSHLN